MWSAPKGALGVCGIIGYVGDRPVGPLLLACLKRLEYRGYDSAGVASVSGRRVYVKKDKGKINEIHARINLADVPGTVGMGHTRWATHGMPSQWNAHPLLDCRREIAVVHNGIIDNYRELKEELLARGHVFDSETDSEVIPHLIEEYVAARHSTVEAVSLAVKQLSGSYAIAVLNAREPDRIVAARYFNPLVVGLGKEEAFVASDIPAFLEYTRTVLFVDDGEVAVLTRNSCALLRASDGSPIERDPVTVDWTIEMAEKGGYPHFMLKEIHEGPSAVRNAILELEKIEEVARVLNAGTLHITACGTSYHAGLVAKYQFGLLCNIPTHATIASEFPSIAGRVLNKGSVVLAITQSGETADVLAAIREAKAAGAKTIAIVNVLGSTATRLADEHLYMRAGPEICVIATKTYLAQLAVLSALSTYLALHRGKLSASEARELIDQLRSMPRVVEATIKRNEPLARGLAEACREERFFFIGRGVGHPTALEGALKLKEASYVYAEGYPAGELKHGPFAVLEPGFPVVAVVQPGAVYDKMLANIEEVSARGAKVLAVAEEGDEEVRRLSQAVFEVPAGVNELLTPIVYVVPLHLFAYYMAVKRGCDPDKPRHLAKSVTVE